MIRVTGAMGTVWGGGRVGKENEENRRREIEIERERERERERGGGGGGGGQTHRLTDRQTLR